MPLHIVMIDRTFSLPEEKPGESCPDGPIPAKPPCTFCRTGGAGNYSHLFRLGRVLVNRGHRVTVLAGGDSLPVDGGEGQITLLQRDGLAVIRYTPRRRLFNPVRRFARWAADQGKKLPRPGLILAAVSCLADCHPALFLHRFYRVPLVFEVRRPLVEVAGAAGIRHWKPFLLCALHRRRRAYHAPDTVIALNESVAQEVRDPVAGGRRPLCLTGNGSAEGLLDRYAAVLRVYTEESGSSN